MIRFKDKVFEEYFIDPETAVITDKDGNVQETYLKYDRPFWKGMAVHRIQVYTHLGFIDGLVIHHLDENKLNNALSNLVYLTIAEHIRIHRTGKPLSLEHKAKISRAGKGKTISQEQKAIISRANKGRKHTAESRANMSAAHLGFSPSPETRAKLSALNKGHHRTAGFIWWKNVAEGKSKFCKDCPGEGWVRGRLTYHGQPVLNE